MQLFGHLDLFWVAVCLCVCAKTVVVAKPIPIDISTQLQPKVTDDDYSPEVKIAENGEEEESYATGGDMLYIPDDYEYAYGEQNYTDDPTYLDYEDYDHPPDENYTEYDGEYGPPRRDYFEGFKLNHYPESLSQYNCIDGGMASIISDNNGEDDDYPLAENSPEYDELQPTVYAADGYYEDYPSEQFYPYQYECVERKKGNGLYDYNDDYPGVNIPLIGDEEKGAAETKDGAHDDSHTSSSPGGGIRNNTERFWFQFLCLFPSLCSLVLYLA